MKFNINETVRVKLTEHGKEILRKNHADFVSKFGNSLYAKKEFQLPQEDKEGFSKWQMWVLFSDFGDHINMGCTPPFDLTIDIPDKNERHNTAWSRLVEGWAKFARRVVSYFKRDSPA